MARRPKISTLAYEDTCMYLYKTDAMVFPQRKAEFTLIEIEDKYQMVVATMWPFLHFLQGLYVRFCHNASVCFERVPKTGMNGMKSKVN